MHSMSGAMVAVDAADLSQLLSWLVHCFMCCGDATILSGHGVGVGRHIVLGRCVCIVDATGLGQPPLVYSTVSHVSRRSDYPMVQRETFVRAQYVECNACRRGI